MSMTLNLHRTAATRGPRTEPRGVMVDQAQIDRFVSAGAGDRSDPDDRAESFDRAGEAVAPALCEGFDLSDGYVACQAACSGVTAVVHELSESFGKAIDAKDPFTKNHSDEVAVVAHALALSMGLGAQEADIIHIAGHLHDIGKIGVPDCILGKPGALTAAEWAQVRRHPEVGAAILSPVRSLAVMGIPAIVVSHHERWDGRGYPAGLAGQAIPLGARVIAVADTLSAILQHRPYRAARDFQGACEEVARCVGAQFDPRVVDAFMSVREVIYQNIVQLKESWIPLQPQGSEVKIRQNNDIEYQFHVARSARG